MSWDHLTPADDAWWQELSRRIHLLARHKANVWNKWYVEADDLHQVGMIAVFEFRSQYDPTHGNNFGYFILKARWKMSRYCRDAINARRQVCALDDELIEPSANVCVEEDVARKEVRMQTALKINTLPDRQQVIAKQIINGYTMAEVADLERTTPDAVRKSFIRALSSLGLEFKSPISTPTGVAATKIMRVLSQTKHATSLEISRLTGVPKPTIVRTVRQLLKEGKIVKAGVKPGPTGSGLATILTIAT